MLSSWGPRALPTKKDRHAGIFRASAVRHDEGSLHFRAAYSEVSSQDNGRSCRTPPVPCRLPGDLPPARATMTLAHGCSNEGHDQRLRTQIPQRAYPPSVSGCPTPPVPFGAEIPSSVDELMFCTTEGLAPSISRPRSTSVPRSAGACDNVPDSSQDYWLLQPAPRMSAFVPPLRNQTHPAWVVGRRSFGHVPSDTTKHDFMQLLPTQAAPRKWRDLGELDNGIASTTDNECDSPTATETEGGITDSDSPVAYSDNDSAPPLSSWPASDSDSPAPMSDSDCATTPEVRQRFPHVIGSLQGKDGQADSIDTSTSSVGSEPTCKPVLTSCADEQLPCTSADFNASSLAAVPFGGLLQGPNSGVKHCSADSARYHAVAAKGLTRTLECELRDLEEQMQSLTSELLAIKAAVPRR